MLLDVANRIQGIQSYYFARKLAEIEEMNQRGETVLNLGIGSPDLPPDESVVNALHSATGKEKAHQYQSYRGIPELRMAFSQWYQRHFSVAMNAQTEILPLVGSKEGIMHLSMAFLNEGDQVLVPNPGYPAYQTVVKICGAEPIPYTLSAEQNWHPDFEALEQLDLSKVKMMWVNYPHMPTGALGSLELFQKLIDFGKKHQILICHDNPYTFILNEEPLSIFQAEGAKEVAVELTSLSKNYNMAGWRVGALAANAEIIQAVLTFKSNMDSGMFRPVQEAAIQALQLGENWHTQLNESYRQRRQKVWELMDQLGCSYDQNSAGLFVWGKIPQKWSSGQEFSDAILKKARVFIAPGFIFGSQGEEYIRISLCSPETIFAQAVERISISNL